MDILAMRNAANPQSHPELDKRKVELESQLRAQFADRDAIKTLPAIQAYGAYYKRFKKTYHVLLQLESVALKGKPIPRVGALVVAMFMAKLKNQLLKAGHDLAAIRTPVWLDVAKGDERYILLNGHEQVLKDGDMMMADGEGVISGGGKEAVRRHLEDLKANVQLIAPAAEVESLTVIGSE